MKTVRMTEKQYKEYQHLIVDRVVAEEEVETLQKRVKELEEFVMNVLLTESSDIEWRIKLMFKQNTALQGKEEAE